jgi:hypothetical protein
MRSTGRMYAANSCTRATDGTPSLARAGTSMCVSTLLEMAAPGHIRRPAVERVGSFRLDATLPGQRASRRAGDHKIVFSSTPPTSTGDNVIRRREPLSNTNQRPAPPFAMPHGPSPPPCASGDRQWKSVSDSRQHDGLRVVL